MSVEKLLGAYARETQGAGAEEERLQDVIRVSKEAFWNSEMEGETTWLEFLYQQAAYIRKRWWLAQGAVLAVMWLVLCLSDSSTYVRRCMGILTPWFAVFLLPELWKNRSSRSMEVEGASYYPLQKIYAARLMLFAMVDVCLISVFLAVSTCSLQVAAADLLIQFVLPLNVTCGICFRTLCGRRGTSVFSSLAACFFWMAGWVFLISNDAVYAKISIPVWIGALLLSFVWLGYSVWRIWKDCRNYYETDFVMQ